MQQSLRFKSQPLHLKPPFSFPHLNGLDELFICNKSATALQLRTGKSRLFHGSFGLSGFNLPSKCTSLDFQKRALVISARKNRRRNGPIMSGKSALECALFIASNLKIFSDPIDLILKEGFGGGGGGSGSGNGFGWGEGFEGWGKRKKRKLGLFELLFLASAIFLVLVSRKEYGECSSDLGFGILGVFLLGTLQKDWQRGFKNWVLGFCSCAFMVIIMGLKRDEWQRWIQGINVRFPVMRRLLGRRRRRRLF